MSANIKKPQRELLKLSVLRNDVCFKSKPFIFGVDPGLSGAIAVVDIATNDIIDMLDMPIYEKKSEARKSGVMRYLDIHKLSAMIDLYAPHTAAAILEEVGAMPEQGLSSTFRFGYLSGQIHGVLAGHYIPTFSVKPAVWKMALGLSFDKSLSQIRATKEFLGFEWLWDKRKHADRAEAALLTIYGRKYLKDFIEFARKKV